MSRPRPSQVLRQNVDALEARAVGQACLMQDIACARVPLDDLIEHEDALRAGALPVGSVEFVREAMRVAGAAEPGPLSYPPELDHLLGRHVDLVPLDRVRGARFVKPLQTKLFTGFVWRESARDTDYSEHDLEQLQALRSLTPRTMVWVSEPVSFLCEWRYYVLDGKVIGSARYDSDGYDDAPQPSETVVGAAMHAMQTLEHSPVAYALDMGVLADGRTVLVEVNDAWALGLYGRGLSPQDYLQLLSARWSQIAASRFRPDLKARPGPKAG